MNLDTVRKCAEIAAAQRLSAMGVVDADIAELLAELTPAAEPELSLVTEEAAPVEAQVEEQPAAE